MKTSFPSSLSVAFTRLGCSAAIALLTGCVTTRNIPDEVTSPPPPIIGSAPIMAHDAYARAMFSRSSMWEASLVALARPPAEPARPAKPPVAKVSMN